MKPTTNYNTPSPVRNGWAGAFLILIFSFFFAACQNDAGVLQMNQELGLLTWYGPGTHATFLSDEGKTYTVTNNVSFDLKTDTAYRVMMYYTVLDDNPNECHFEAITRIPVLSDSTLNTAKCDTLRNVDAVWVKGGFINFTLTFMHDNRHDPLLQTFGYRVKSNTVGSDGTRTAVITPFYRHNDAEHADILYYPMQYTFSIRPEDLGLVTGDRIILEAEWKNPVDGLMKDRFTRQI